MQWQEWLALADNAQLWQGQSEKGLLKAEYVDGYTLRLWFENAFDVSIYELDFYPLVVQDNSGGVFRALQERARFQIVRGEYALIWPNPETGAYDEQAIDLAPECVRFFLRKVRQSTKSVGKTYDSPRRYVREPDMTHLMAKIADFEIVLKSNDP